MEVFPRFRLCQFVLFVASDVAGAGGELRPGTVVYLLCFWGAIVLLYQRTDVVWSPATGDRIENYLRQMCGWSIGRCLHTEARRDYCTRSKAQLCFT